MVNIKCVNSKCTSPSKSFDWDETRYVKPGGGIAHPNENGAVRMVAVCPFCAAKNIVWIKQPKITDLIFREIEEDE